MGVLDRIRSVFSRAPNPKLTELPGAPKPVANSTLPYGSSPPDEPTQVLPDLSLWLQFQRIGGGLTPQQVSDIIRSADVGFMYRLVDLANEMRQKDGHLHAVLQTRETAVTRLRWELFYEGQDPKSEKGLKERKFVECALRASEGFNRMLGHLAGAIYYGYAVSEIIWEIEKGKLVPKRYINHSPRRFRYMQANGLFVWHDVNMGEPVDIKTDYPDKFLMAHPRVTGDVPVREGLARNLMWLALFRNWTLADWLKLAEIAWKPWRLGKYKKTGNNTASKEDKDGLASILSSMSSSGVAVYPDTTEVELKWPEASGTGRSDHAGLFEVAGKEMSKCVLGQTLTTEQGKVGSQALGKVHEGVKQDIIDSDAAYLAEILTEQLIAPMIRMNFGPGVTVPKFRFITKDAVDLLQLAQALDYLTGPNVQMRIPAQWAREQAGIPDPAEGDEILGDYDVDLSDLDKPGEPPPLPPLKPANDDGDEEPAQAA